MAHSLKPAFDLEQHPFYWLTQVIDARDRQLNQALREHGLRVPEWRALAALAARGLMSMSELSDAASIDRTTLTRTVDRMQAAGWVTRVADDADLRVTRLALATAGERLFVRIRPIVERLNRAALAGLSDDSVYALRASLARMRANLDAELSAQRRAA
ncbi:MAG: MarR family transcriptional regulator [Betaproteobacteria bacterium]|nr:MarR family transcriptional regulator [Betaproteobacteria bacterium]